MRFWRRIAILATAIAGIATVPATAAEPVRTDLTSIASRFSSDVYPLLVRAANGCRACHDAESSQRFRVLDSPGATLSLMLEHGLLALDDPLSIPGRLDASDPDLRMPQAGEWREEERDIVRRFSIELGEALQALDATAGSAPDERYPDALLLPFDGPERDEQVHRRLSFYQLRQSYGVLFGERWLSDSGRDPFAHRAHRFGGADFRASFDESRAVSASYLSSLQGVAREVARRFVSAPREALFEGFDPNVSVASSRRRAAANVRALYERILFLSPPVGETRQALDLVRELQDVPQETRTVRFTLEVEDSEGHRDTRHAETVIRATGSSVARFEVDQSRSGDGGSGWVRVGDSPFRFEPGNADQFVRVLAHPGNHVTVFDAVALARVVEGSESDDWIVIDNLDPECVLSGEWEPVEKEGERSRAGPAKKRYEQDLLVVGSNHLESRTLDNRLAYATVSPRIPSSGAYNVYLAWPAIPRAATRVMVEVRSASDVDSAPPARDSGVPDLGHFRVRIDQTESTLDDAGETQWELVHREVHLSGSDDYVEISNLDVDATSRVIVADAVRFVPLDGGEPIVVDNASEDGFEKSDGWAPDQLTRNAPGRGRMFGEDVLHYPPSKDGSPIKDQEIDPEAKVWARYRPVVDGAYRAGWYRIELWTPGGHTHSDWVAIDIHGGGFAPVAAIEAIPELGTGETAVLNGTGTHHPLGHALTYRWRSDADDLGLRLLDADTATPRFVVPALASTRSGWAGLIEALLQRPEFLLPGDGVDSDPRRRLARIALDLVGRIPTRGEFRRFGESRDLGGMIDSYLDSEDFKDFFFHRARVALRSRGTEESDEPARLWTHIATHDRPYRELFTADYTVDANWEPVSRRAEHGPTGILTMKGYLVGKPGLPKFTYPAQVLRFALGMQFEVSDAVEQAREKVVSTTDPASMCYSCHKLLTPLAYQRERWDEHGHYRTVDDNHEPIDDSDRGVVTDYPFAGEGLGAFSTQMVRKERFVRSFINTHHDILFHRQLRVFEDQRDEYRELYEFAVGNDLRIRPLLKRLLLMRHGPA